MKTFLIAMALLTGLILIGTLGFYGVGTYEYAGAPAKARQAEAQAYCAAHDNCGVIVAADGTKSINGHPVRSK
jgi:hypothetical protein